jgi:hypothetical protein
MSITVDVAVSDRGGLTARGSAAVSRLLRGMVRMPAGLEVAPGELVEFDPRADTTLEVERNVLVLGRLRMRPDPGVTHTLRFVGVDESLMAGGGMEVRPSDVGLWVLGRLDIAGTPKTEWAWAAGGLLAGQETVELDRPPVGWLPGDEVAVTPTAPGLLAWLRYDVRTVLSVDGTTVRLTEPLAHDHPAVEVGGRVLTAEVLNLTRNVRVEGTPAGRAHVMVLGGRQQISHAVFRYLGPRQADGQYTRGVPGRYPLHFHQVGDGSRGSLVEGVVVRDSGHRGLVPHESHGITFRRCITHNTYDEPYWYDLGGDTRTPQPPSHDLTLVECVASLVKVDPAHQGYTLTGFLLGNGDRNRCVGCVAVGVQGNKNASGFLWPEGAGIGSGLWDFDQCVAHNNRVNGLFAWQNGPDPHEIRNYTAYHNGGAGIADGAYVHGYQYHDSHLTGNGWSGLDVHANSHGSSAVPLTFENLTVDAAGDYAVRVLKHTLPPGGTTVLRNCAFRGYRKAAVGFTYTGSNGPTTADRLDIVDCQRDERLPWVEFLAPLMPGSLVRVIENGQVVDEWKGPDASSDSLRA